MAVAILALSLLASVKLMTVATRTTRKGDFYAIAAHAATDKIDQCQAGGYASLTSGTTNSTVSGLPQGNMKVTIGPLAGNATNTNILQVDVTVTWKPYGASGTIGGQVQISTLVSAPYTTSSSNNNNNNGNNNGWDWGHWGDWGDGGDH